MTYLNSHISMHQKGKHNIKISSEKKIWPFLGELHYAFHRFHWTIWLTTCPPGSPIRVNICEFEICEIKNASHCLGLINAGIVYAITSVSMQPTAKGNLSYKWLS